MLPYVIAATIGAVWATRRGPNVSFSKKTMLGPKTGLTYQVDDYTKAGMVMVKAKDGTIVVLTKRPGGQSGFVFQHSTGNPKVVELIKSDFLEPKASK